MYYNVFLCNTMGPRLLLPVVPLSLQLHHHNRLSVCICVCFLYTRYLSVSASLCYCVFAFYSVPPTPLFTSSGNVFDGRQSTSTSKYQLFQLSVHPKDSRGLSHFTFQYPGDSRGLSVIPHIVLVTGRTLDVVLVLLYYKRHFFNTSVCLPRALDEPRRRPPCRSRLSRVCCDSKASPPSRPKP